MDGTRPYNIVVAEAFDAPSLARLRELGHVHVLTDSAPESLLAAVPLADALLIRGKAHVTARIIQAAPRLKVIARASPNVDHIDLRAARQRQIKVVYAPHVAVTSTAEFTLALILNLHRKLIQFDHHLREGKFDALRVPCGHEMHRLTLGLLGVDPVAECLGRMCSTAFNMPIAYHDPTDRTPTDFQGTALAAADLLARCDVLSIHLPLNTQTRHFVNETRLAQMKPTAFLVNTSRGGLIDTIALAKALRKRLLAGAALDVFECEPLPLDHPLRSSPNCILTPHVAGTTLDASTERFSVTDDVIRILRGESPRHVLDPLE